MVQYLGDFDTAQPELLAEVVGVSVLDTSLQYLVAYNCTKHAQKRASYSYIAS